MWIYSKEVYVDLGLRALCGSTPRTCMWIYAEVVLSIYSEEMCGSKLR